MLGGPTVDGSRYAGQSGPVATELTTFTMTSGKMYVASTRPSASLPWRTMFQVPAWSGFRVGAEALPDENPLPAPSGAAAVHEYCACVAPVRVKTTTTPVTRPVWGTENEATPAAFTVVLPWVAVIPLIR